MPDTGQHLARQAYAIQKAEADYHRAAGNMPEAERCENRAAMIWRRFIAPQGQPKICRLR